MIGAGKSEKFCYHASRIESMKLSKVAVSILALDFGGVEPFAGRKRYVTSVASGNSTRQPTRDTNAARTLILVPR